MESVSLPYYSFEINLNLDGLTGIRYNRARRRFQSISSRLRTEFEYSVAHCSDRGLIMRRIYDLLKPYEVRSSEEQTFLGGSLDGLRREFITSDYDKAREVMNILVCFFGTGEYLSRLRDSRQGFFMWNDKK